MVDTTPYIIASVLAAAAYIYGKKESNDNKQFNELKHLLATSITSQHSQQLNQPPIRSPKLSKRVQLHTNSDSSDSDDEAAALRNKKHKQQQLGKRGSTSSLHGFYPSSSNHINKLLNTRGGNTTDDLAGDIDLLKSSLLKLDRRNQLLQKQLALAETSNVVEADTKYTTGSLTASEIETIRGIFNLFDTKRNGSIKTKELQAIHQKLGEPLTDEEAEDAMMELDPEGTEEVTFNKFVYWWYESHKGGKKTTHYTNRFKLLNAKLSDSTFSVDKIVVQDSGAAFTLEYRLNFYYKQSNGELRQISPWHDIPLYRLGQGNNAQIFNFICEIPKWTRAKFEVATGEPYNPIKQDTKNGQLRYYKHGDMMFNYGCFPQTWEDPNVSPEDTQHPGDNDPIDVLEIGSRQLKTGSVTAVKILGVLALIDDGETDWKVIAINIADSMAHLINDVDDVETHIPGAIRAIREYLRDYKNYAGGCLNKYALNERAMPRDYAIRVVEETHQYWKGLHKSQSQGIKNDKVWVARSRSNSVAGTPIDNGTPISTSVGGAAMQKLKQFEVPEKVQQRMQEKNTVYNNPDEKHDTVHESVNNIRAVGLQSSPTANVE